MAYKFLDLSIVYKQADTAGTQTHTGAGEAYSALQTVLRLHVQCTYKRVCCCHLKMTLSIRCRRKIIFLRKRNLSYRAIVKHIEHFDGTTLSHRTALQWCRKLTTGASYVYSDKRPNKGIKARKIEDVHMKFLDTKITENPEVSPADLQKVVLDEYGLRISCSYIGVLRRRLGWVSKRTRYGQMVRENNRATRVQWADQMIRSGETFHDVIFSDECSFEAQRSATRTYYKKGERVRPRPKPKHPVKVSKILFSGECVLSINRERSGRYA